MSVENFPCPCCDYKTFEDKPNGTYVICPVCFWEDDPVQLSDVDYEGGANRVSLRQGQRNYLEFGACQRELATRVRKPRDEEEQDEGVREPLERALLRRRVKPGMIVHSDRGGQYLSHKMKKLIKTFKLKQNGPPRGMSRADDPYDNAWAESFWSRLKAELNMPKGGYESLDKLKTVLLEYIDGYYNTRRLHSSLNYLNPVDFEAEYYRQTG